MAPSTTDRIATIDRDRLARLIDRERAAYRANFPASGEAFAAAGKHLLGGVPMTWMRMWPGGFPLFQATASGARLTDLDGHEFIDFCLGDTAAMAGHSPAAVQAAVSRRYAARSRSISRARRSRSMPEMWLAGRPVVDRAMSGAYARVGSACAQDGARRRRVPPGTGPRGLVGLFLPRETEWMRRWIKNTAPCKPFVTT